MTIPVLGDIIGEVGKIIEKVVPDADKRMDLQLQLAQLADQAAARESQLLEGQIDVNKVEAANGVVFVSGWRPFIGWVCGTSLAYTWIVAPIAKACFRLATLPVIDPTQIYPIVLAMLGVAGMRTYEKVQGVASGALSTTTTIQAPQEAATKPASTITSKIGNWFK